MQTLQTFFIIESNPATINTMWNSSTIFYHCKSEEIGRAVMYITVIKCSLGLWKDQSDGDYQRTCMERYQSAGGWWPL